MKTIRIYPWVRYLSDDYQGLDPQKCGKWMYFFDDVKFADEICKKAILEGVVSSDKHSDDPTGVCCFYIEIDDIEAHKRVIEFFFANCLIPKNKNGNYRNIAFKLDNQTRNHEYGENFKSKLNLSDFVDLKTGEWIK